MLCQFSRTLAFIVVFLVSVGPSRTETPLDQDYVSDQAIDRFCRGLSDRTFFEGAEGVLRYCDGFIAAVTEAYDAARAKGHWQYCLPKNIEIKSLKSRYMAFMARSKRREPRTAVSVIAHSLEEAYPCRHQGTAPVRFISTRMLVAACDKAQAQSGAGFCYGYIQGTIEALDGWTETAHVHEFCRTKGRDEPDFTPFSRLSDTTSKFIIEVLARFRTETDLKILADKSATEWLTTTLAEAMPCDCISVDKFNRITIGMEYWDVARVMGCKATSCFTIAADLTLSPIKNRAGMNALRGSSSDLGGCYWSGVRKYPSFASRAISIVIEKGRVTKKTSEGLE